jgi:uncharacterized protein with FMN-binding domain
MKRVLLSTMATIAGLVALLSFKSHGHPLAAGTGGLPQASLAPAAGQSAPATTGGTASSSAAPTPHSSASRTAAPTTSAAPATQSYTGDAVQTQYGVVQVKVAVSGKRITNVGFVQLTAYDSRSQFINSQAAPILLQETLSAQSSNIDAVSGASYTSAGYVQSLQSALDRAGI